MKRKFTEQLTPRMKAELEGEGGGALSTSQPSHAV